MPIFKRRKLSFKKVNLVDARQDINSEFYINFCKKLCSKLKICDINKVEHNFVYVDEMGIYIGKNYQKGYAKLGEDLPTQKSFLENQRIKINIIGCLQNGVPTNLFTVDGTVDSEVFELWFKNLLKDLKTTSTIILDNAKFHRKTELFNILKEYNKENKTFHTLLFQPPYSPEVNLIENFWAKLKNEWKKVLNSKDFVAEKILEIFHNFLNENQHKIFSKSCVKITENMQKYFF